MPIPLPIGLSDFRTLREQGAWYADKSSLLVGVLESSTQVYLFPRPRRFGKSLNLSMFRYYLEKRVDGWDATPIFQDLVVWRSEQARAHFQRYPTIALSFKNAKHRDWQANWVAVRAEIARIFIDHRYLLDSALASDDVARFTACLEERIDPTSGGDSLALLSRLLHAHHGEKVVILVDEYDVPIHTGFLGGFYEPTITFFRAFLTAGLKDNPHLFRAVMTGVLRIAKESIFSGLNNLEVWSVLFGRFATDFGFTDDEVRNLLMATGCPDAIDEVRRWYDGYRFGGHTIYNPWSVLNFARRPESGGLPYWVHTSSDDLLQRVLLERGHTLVRDIETWMAGGTISRAIEENVVFADLDTSPDAAFSLLLMSGYLTPRAQANVRGRMFCDLAIPNLEIQTLFETVIQDWLKERAGRGDHVQHMLSAMLRGDAFTFERMLSDLVVRTFSVHDVVRPEPERVYQAFLLGLLVTLQDEYEIRSNREAGYGRYDVSICPKRPGRPGAVIELKEIDRRSRESRKAALASALAQIRERRYAEELEARGATPIHRYAVVFDGKRVVVGEG